MIGDALGVPYEFHAAHEIPPAAEIEYDPPKGFRRAHHGVPPGTWSDDGAHALALLDSLLARNALDLDDLGKRLRAWRDDGYLAVGGRVFDCGIQTSRALHNLVRGVPAERSGPAGGKDNGNGALMRVLPLALWHAASQSGGPDATRLVFDAHRQGLVTHGHEQSQVCCALVCLWAVDLLQGGGGGGLDAAGEQLSRIYRDRQLRAHALVLERIFESDYRIAPTGGGYVVDTLWTVEQAMRADSYEGAVRNAIARGRDTDTTACIAGGLAGMAVGKSGLPERWRVALRGQELVSPLLEALLAVRPSPTQ